MDIPDLRRGTRAEALARSQQAVHSVLAALTSVALGSRRQFSAAGSGDAARGYPAFGMVVATLGDVDRDGTPDILIGVVSRLFVPL